MPLDKRVGAWAATKAVRSQTEINSLNKTIAKATQDFLSEVKEVRKKEQQEKEQEKDQSMKQEEKGGQSSVHKEGLEVEHGQWSTDMICVDVDASSQRMSWQ